MPAEIREAVSKLIDFSESRHIGFSHFESDECGALNEWLDAAPNVDVICKRGWRPLFAIDRLPTDRLPICPTAGKPMCSSKETQKMLLCSDLFHQVGDVETLISADVVGTLASGVEGISGGHSRGLRALHTAYRAELEKARRSKARDARHHACL
jgi:hypothetical protein